MDEWALVLVAFCRLLIVFVFAACYMIGGRKWKWVRRFVGSAILMTGTIGVALFMHTFKWWMVFGYLVYPISLSLPYGADNLLSKILKRGFYGLCLGASSLVFGSWVLAGLQISISVAVSIYLGVINPTDAVDEECLIASSSVLFVPFMV